MISSKNLQSGKLRFRNQHIKNVLENGVTILCPENAYISLQMYILLNSSMTIAALRHTTDSIATAHDDSTTLDIWQWAFVL